MSKSTQGKLPRYRQLRAAHSELYDNLRDWVPGNAVEECARTLGFDNEEKLIFASDSELSALMDYLIYDYRPDGQNVIERYVDQVPVKPDSDEKIILDAMLEASYSLFVINEVVEGVGVQTYDLLRDDNGFLVDIEFSKTAVKGDMLVSRLISPGDLGFSMITGGTLSLDNTIIQKLTKVTFKRFGERPMEQIGMPHEKAAEFTALVIRVFLENHESSLLSEEDAPKQGVTRAKSKTRGNVFCSCGSGKKYEKCCGATTKVVLPRDRRLMERNLWAIQKMMSMQEFGSVDEMNAHLQQFNLRGRFPPWVPETPMEQAQELIYQALTISDQKERIRVVMDSLELCRDCADAYVLLAEETAETTEEALNWYRRGVEAGERALGAEVFANKVGHFWGVIETRPYMRSCEGLADCLYTLGEHSAAIQHYQDMLRLNPNDNQGIRYKLLNCLLEGNDTEAATELLGRYKEDYSAVWFFTRALITFCRYGAGQEANKQFREAVKYNPYVVPYLLGQKRIPRSLPDRIGFGDKNEAVVYVAEFASCWLDADGALEWVKAKTRVKK